MLTKSILAGAAFALAATTGAASAGDPAAAGPALAQEQFSVLAGVPAAAMGDRELSVISGGFFIRNPDHGGGGGFGLFVLTGSNCVLVGTGVPVSCG